MVMVVPFADKVVPAEPSPQEDAPPSTEKTPAKEPTVSCPSVVFRISEVRLKLCNLELIFFLDPIPRIRN
jgi:hypothetical protein